MRNKNDIGQVLKNRLRELNESPDLSVWNTIETELQAHKRKKLYKRIAIILALFFCLYVLFIVINDKKRILINKTEIQENNLNTSFTKKDTIRTFNVNNSINENQKITHNTNQINKPTDNNHIIKHQKTNTKNKTIDDLNNNGSFDVPQKTKFKNRAEKNSSHKNHFDTIKKTDYNNSSHRKIKTIIKHNTLNSSRNFSFTNNAQQIKLKSNKKSLSENKRFFNETKDDSLKITSTNKLSVSTHNYLNLKSKSYHSFKLSTIQHDSLNLKKITKDSTKVISSRWSISVNGGINYTNTGLKENIIHNNIQKKKSNSITESYGVRLNYRLNDKLFIRFGLQKLSFRFNTSNIANNNPNIRIDSIINTNNALPLITTNDLITKLNNSSSFELKEISNYLEFPLEIKYKLPKIENISLIAGTSYLHLLNSDVYVNSNNINQFKIAKSLDARKSAYSFNIGLGYDLKLSENFYLNFEGYFKQYLGIYESNGTNFNTQNINFHTGFTFKF